jgi:hypothetical protein
MAGKWQMGALFLAGLVLGGAVGAWIGHTFDASSPVVVPAPAAAAAAPALAAPVTPVRVAAPERVSAVPIVLTGPHACAYAPVVERAGHDDGQELLQPPTADATAAQAAALLLTGKEAAAAGRQRDAEIDFLNACHVAEIAAGAQGLPVAEAQYQLARHYGNLLLAGAANRAELRRRAEELYTGSFQLFRAIYGERGEKTRFAREGLAAVEQAMTPAHAKRHAVAKPHRRVPPHTHAAAR